MVNDLLNREKVVGLPGPGEDKSKSYAEKLSTERPMGTRRAYVTAASMERRPGEQYAFTEPLLEQVVGSNCFDV